ncbi:MAG: hypothetical protein H2172_12370 [Opitutus sp.]|nr:hypothetical protein [Opitutus sp.]
MVKKLAAANQKLEELDQRWTIFKAGLVGIVLPGDPITGARGRAGAYAKVQSAPSTCGTICPRSPRRPTTQAG